MSDIHAGDVVRVIEHGCELRPCKWVGLAGIVQPRAGIRLTVSVPGVGIGWFRACELRVLLAPEEARTLARTITSAEDGDVDEGIARRAEYSHGHVLNVDRLGCVNCAWAITDPETDCPHVFTAVAQ